MSRTTSLKYAIFGEARDTLLFWRIAVRYRDSQWRGLDVDVGITYSMTELPMYGSDLSHPIHPWFILYVAYSQNILSWEMLVVGSWKRFVICSSCNENVKDVLMIMDEYIYEWGCDKSGTYRSNCAVTSSLVRPMLLQTTPFPPHPAQQHYQPEAHLL